MIRSLLVVFLLGLSSLPLAAQDYIELAQLGYRYSFRTDALEGQSEGRVIEGKRINLLVPLKISEKTYLLPGVRYWQYNFNPGDNLNWYLIQLGFQTQLSEKTSWQFLPLIRSGMYEGASFGEGFQLGLLTTVNRQVNDRLMLGYGIYTNHELFGQLLTPVLAIDWQISDRWRLFGNFPMFNTLAYDLGEKWNTGLNYLGLVTSFRGKETYIERESIEFSWFLEYYITKQLVTQVRFGYPFGREFVEYDKDDKVDFSLSLIRFGDNREALATFDDVRPFVTFNLFFRIKK